MIAEMRCTSDAWFVRRTRLVGAQAALWPTGATFAFITDRSEELELVEAEHESRTARVWPFVTVSGRARSKLARRPWILA
ncbi:MAG TPA: hypothetical protein VII41_07900 [Steroidobacteraceae bacterium]